jgi:hypothetical protein
MAPSAPEWKASYAVHNNGGRPLLVIVDATGWAEIWGWWYMSNDAVVRQIPKKRLLRFQFLDVWPGRAYGTTWTFGDESAEGRIVMDHPVRPGRKVFRYPEGDGNTVLFRIGPNKYRLVYKDVRDFEVDADCITAFYSEIGNNDCPNPVAVGAHNAYLLVEWVKVPLSALGNGKDLAKLVTSHDSLYEKVISKKRQTPMSSVLVLDESL